MKIFTMNLFSLFAIVASGCGDKPVRIQAFAFKNPTSHYIKIIPFDNGNIIAERIVELTSNSILVMDTISGPADRDIPPKFYPFFNGFDSVQVYFDGQSHITHLLAAGYTSGNKHYTPDSPRNFSNPKSASIVKPEWVWEITYTFTEQDFTDASQ